MGDENIYTRFHKDLAALREAESKVERLVQQFSCVAERLANWKKVGFEGMLGQQQLTNPGTTIRIRFDEPPSMEEIYRAKQAWQDARTELKGTLGAMTKEERDEVLPRYPELRALIGY